MDTEKLLPLEVEIVMPFPSVMACPSAVQKAAGEFIRPLAVLDTVQVRLYISPALLTPDLPILAVIALEGTGRFKVYHNQTKWLMIRTKLQASPSIITTNVCSACSPSSLMTLHV